MGVDCTVKLPLTVSETTIEKAVAILLGAKPRWYVQANYGSDSAWAEADGVKIKSEPSISFTYGRLEIDAKLQEAAAKRLGFEGVWLSPSIGIYTDTTKGGLAVNPTWHITMKSTPAKIALVTALARLFGGTVDENDCDSKPNKRYKRQLPPDASDGRAWNTFEQAMMKIKPLEKKDLRPFTKVASYEDKYE